MDLKLEVVVVPVSDLSRAKEFYEAAGFRMDIEHVGGDDFRVVTRAPGR
jgi:predicted lactoylglutathione lyase